MNEAPFWIWIDIDGCGRQWHLAFHRGEMIVFPMDDFEDYADPDEDRPVVQIEVPQPPEDNQ